MKTVSRMNGQQFHKLQFWVCLMENGASYDSAPKAKKENAPTSTVQSNVEPGSSDPDKYCSLCQAFFNHPAIAKQHYVGKRHKKRETKAKLLEQLGQTDNNSAAAKGYPCNTCNIVLNSIEQYQAHIQGTKHQNQNCMKMVHHNYSIWNFAETIVIWITTSAVSICTLRKFRFSKLGV
ncbi:zinc finger protein 346-like [Rhincodon typus]|uniref:zinc finger protein 346-like n=1 Tax=Rhincodon typus TaxID=259920 RepID=UPI00203024A3|nr:zinc finger protein 346-like [Rhincodon typus]